VILLWHDREPVGICVFASPAGSLAARSRFFGLAGRRSRTALAALNDQLWLLARVVLHPTYRGAGIASAFIRRSCELCAVDWIETLSAMARANPVFERAGFVRAGVVNKGKRRGNGPYARGWHATNPHSEPVYYVRDNRRPVATPPGFR
jgi:GNAT superfamily N-acetyltransferase